MIDVTSFITGPNSTSYLNYLTPGNAIFNNPKAIFASNARTIGFVAKFTLSHAHKATLRGPSLFY